MPRAHSRRRGRGRRRAAIGRGIVLSAGRIESAASWARRGLGELTMAAVEGWTMISATGPAQARYPYDDAVRTLAGRPVSWRMRPALGFFKVGAQAVIVLHPAGMRPVVRWLIWTPHHGLVAPEGLPAARIPDVVVVSGLDTRVQARAAAALAALLRRADLEAAQILTGALDILALPGAGVLTGDTCITTLPGARSVSPKARYAREFDRLLDELELERSGAEA